jgi:AcrR family transcriptional regulator
VSADAFYDVFESAEDCILAAFAEGLERLSQTVLEAAQREERWLERIRAGLIALLAFLDGERDWGRLLILERSLEETAALEYTGRVQDALADVLREGRGEVILGAELAPSTELIAELVTLGVLSVVRARLLKGQGAPLVELAPELMSFILVPYLGRGAAKADLAQKPGSAGESWPRAVVVPIRPHPRTMLALRVIASAPRLSNRQVAAAVGIQTEGGHSSELLKPLEQRGLIENASLGRAPREPNAWLLTPYGHRVLEVITDSFAAARRREAQEGVPGRASSSSVRRSTSANGRLRSRAA